MKRNKKDLKQLNCFKIKLENTRNKFSLNIENCCSCRENRLSRNLMSEARLYQHYHTCYSGSKLSRSNSENYTKSKLKNPQMFSHSNNRNRTFESSISNSNSSNGSNNNNNNNSNQAFLNKSPFKGDQSPKRHLSTYELNKSVLNNSTSNKKENFTSRYEFQKKFPPLPSSRDESSSRYQMKLPDFRRSIDRIYSMENTSASTSIESKLRPPPPPLPSMPKISTEKHFFTTPKTNNAQKLFKEPVNAQRKMVPKKIEKLPTFNDSDSYLDSIRNLSSSELNSYIEKLINQFRIKTKIDANIRPDPDKLNKAFTMSKETKEATSKKDTSQQQAAPNVNNMYRDDLFVVSEMSIKNSNASEDTYIKKILNDEDDQEESVSVEELNLEEESEESNGLINYTHSYELEDLSSQNTSFNQESSGSVKK